MRIEKKNLPRTKIGIQSKWVLCAGYFLFIFMISYLFASGGRQLDGTPYEEYVGDFYQMNQNLENYPLFRGGKTGVTSHQMV
jgi:hypothetical protein